jgi:predicted XRE-type DNA-binding protein
MGMPLIDHLGGDLWEVRSKLDTRIARTLFMIEGSIARFHQEAAENTQAGSGSGERALETVEETKMTNPHIGSNFYDFLAEEAMLEEATAVAVKRVIAWQIEQEMAVQKLMKTAMAKKMHTSRAALNRLVDETDTSLTLTTLASAAAALGRQVRFELCPT